MGAKVTKSGAINHLKGRGGESAKWGAKVAVSPGWAAHSGIFLYANHYYCGTLQLDGLGPALYTIEKPDWEEGPYFELLWGNMTGAMDMTYANGVPTWGPWLCHDFTAYILSGWGLGADFKQRSRSASGPMYRIGRVVGVVAWPGPLIVAATRSAWHRGTQGVRMFERAMQKVELGRPSQWHWGL